MGSPGVSFRENFKIKLNFGEQPFAHPVPEGYLPVLTSTGSAPAQPPGWLRYYVPKPVAAEATVAPAAAGQVVPLLLQQLSTTLQLMQIENARSEGRDAKLDTLL